MGKMFPLVLAGGKGWLMDDFIKELESLDLQQEVILLGYVDDQVLQWLYRNCFAFLYPSYFEGFGLPAMEAMSLGAAVIASNITSIPEIIGQAGILIDPTSQEEIGPAMRKLVSEPGCRNKLREKAGPEGFYLFLAFRRILNRKLLRRSPFSPKTLSGFSSLSRNSCVLLSIGHVQGLPAPF